MADQTSTSGVQELIDRLSQDGVAEGQKQATQILQEAERKADTMIESARQQAADILKAAREESQQLQSAGEEALRLAARDTIRDFGSKVHEGFRERLQSLVQHHVQDPELIRQMILAITRQATEGIDNTAIEILLPRDLVTEEAALQKIESGDHDALMEFVRGLVGEDIRDGFTLNLGSRQHAGLTVRVLDEKLEIDLSEAAITDLLSLHLLPRFRAIMRND